MTIQSLPSKNEMFEEYNKLKSFDEKIEYVKSLRDLDIYNTLKLEYNNIITKLYVLSKKQKVLSLNSKLAIVSSLVDLMVVRDLVLS